ncbi:MAG: hypothetical protein ABJF11_17220 [Reichenbachiella sp.]|uniref:hypothetical protein n=1 Tax=Reichenbachiella sp. TaxID=2184521 RepID=UPI003266BB27
MNLITNIAKYKSFILLVGMLAGLCIVAQPIVRSYVDSAITYQVDQKATDSDQQKDAKEGNPSEVQISVLEAVTPTAQLHLSPLDFTVQDQPTAEAPRSKTLVSAVEVLPEKLLKVLFNIIIAPNAP